MSASAEQKKKCLRNPLPDEWATTKCGIIRKFCSSYWNEINKFYYYSQNLENLKGRLVLNQISKMI